MSGKQRLPLAVAASLILTARFLVAQTPTRSTIAGCYSVALGTWAPDLGASVPYHRLPAHVRLDTTPVGRGAWSLSPDIAYPTGRRFPATPRWSIRADSMVLLWSNGFSPTEAVLHRDNSGWIGTAVARSDVVDPWWASPRARIELQRVSCTRNPPSHSPLSNER
jgi:hypothetical protein